MTTTRPLRMTLNALLILREFVRHPGEDLYGQEIAKSTHVLTGTLYPILQRLEDAGWVTSRWEALGPKDVGRPPRRYYQLTSDGAKRAKRALKTAALAPLLPPLEEP